MLGIRLDRETELALDAIAKRTRRPKSQIAREAIKAYIAKSEPMKRAREEWRRISDRECEDADLSRLLDDAARDLDLP